MPACGTQMETGFSKQHTMNNNRFVPNSYVEESISKLAQEETGKRQYYRPVYSLLDCCDLPLAAANDNISSGQQTPTDRRG
jgi:hypothetical protein